MKTIEIQIDEAIWQYELDKFNKSEQAKVEYTNAAKLKQHQAVMAQTPEAKRTNFSPLPEFKTLTLDDYVVKILTEKEAAIIQSRIADHLTLLSAQSPETIARFAKVTELSDKTKEALAAQVDAL